MNQEAQRRKENNRMVFFSIFFIAIILSSIIYIRELRGYAPYPNGESYYNLRTAQEISKDPLYDKDQLQDRDYYASAYDFVLAICILLVGIKNTIYLGPIIIGVFTAIFFYRLLVNLDFPRSNANFSMMLLAVTPSFLVLFSNLYEEGFVVFLSILALSLYFEKNYWDSPWKPSGKICFALSIATLVLLSVVSLLGFLMTATFTLFLSIFKNRNLKSFLFSMTLPFLMLILLGVFTNYLLFSIKNTYFHYFEISDLFSLFGAKFGFDIFLFLLYGTGLIIIWGHVKSLRAYHLLSLLLVLLSAFNHLILIYSSILLTVYCVFSIKYLYYSRWELDVVKTGTVILLICALLFSCINQVNTIINEAPGYDAMEILDVLERMPPGTVLTEPEYGITVQYFSHKKTMLDESRSSERESSVIFDDYNYILSLVRVNEAEPMLKKYGIKYIFVTPELKENRWRGKEQELLLLLRNSDKFKLIASTESGFELWAY
jgi:hypothetical protein